MSARFAYPALNIECENKSKYKYIIQDAAEDDCHVLYACSLFSHIPEHAGKRQLRQAESKVRENMKRWIVWMLAVLLAVFPLSGCGSETGEGKKTVNAPGESDGLKIGISFDSFVIERWQRDRDVFVSTAQSLGAEVNVQNANGEVSEQIAQIEYLIEKGMDVIAIVAIDQNALTDVVEEARRLGIKIVSYDRLILNAGTDLYISFDNEMVGRLMAEALKDALPEGGVLFRIEGSESDHNVDEVRKGFDEALEGSDLKVLYSASCRNWLAELAFDAVNEGLRETGTVDGVMCGNDDLAGQAIRALTEHKLAGKVPVVGQDAELSGCQRIVEGTQSMTVFKDFDRQAELAARFAAALGRGEDIRSESASVFTRESIFDGKEEIPMVSIEPIAVTSDNIDEVIIDSGFHQKTDVYRNLISQHP